MSDRCPLGYLFQIFKNSLRIHSFVALPGIGIFILMLNAASNVIYLMDDDEI